MTEILANESLLSLESDGTLRVNTDQYRRVKRILLENGTSGTMFYADGNPAPDEDTITKQAVMKILAENADPLGRVNKDDAIAAINEL